MNVQADLFGEPVPARPAAPDGFRYWPDLLSEDEQGRVVRALQALSFKPYEHLGYLGNRRIASFGRRYDLARQALEAAEPWPAFLRELLGQLTDRAECLNAHWFLTLADAAEKLEAWRRDYNEVRPHGAIGNKPPIALMKPGDAASPSP